MMTKLAAALIVVPLSFAGVTQTTINSNICHEIITPTITSPTDQSNLTSRIVQVEGQATSQTSVVVTLDGVNTVLVTADSTDTYATSLSVPSGSHTIGVVSESPCQSKTGTPVTVTGMADPVTPPGPTPPNPIPPSPPSPPRPPTPSPPRPKRVIPTDPSQQLSPDVPLSTEPQVDVETKDDHWLSIETPSEKDMAGATRITLSIKASGAGTVVITKDDKVIAETYRAATAFTLSVPVSEGNNTFVVTATIDGKKITREITVYVAPKAAVLTDAKKEDGFGFWPWIIGGAVILLISIGGVWWLVAARRRRRDEQRNTPPFGGGL